VSTSAKNDASANDAASANDVASANNAANAPAVQKNRFLRGVGRVLWIAITPLAFTVLFATPARAQHGSDAPQPEHDGVVMVEGGEPEGGEHEGAEGEHHAPPKNPILNFANFSYSDKDTHGGKYEPEKGDHKMPAPFSMALLNFGVLLALLGKYAAPAFRKMVADRHDEVAKQLEESSRLRAEAQAKLDEYTRKVNELDAEIAKLVAGIRAEADHDQKRILGEAELRAERMKKEAEQTIAAEIARVRAQLEREATLSAIAAAEKLLADKTTDADHRGLNEQFIRGLAGTRAPRA
jgi:F-type H+-transporting ATPase subunit b